jgi:hypothetical protein
LNRAADGCGLIGEDFRVAFEFHALHLANCRRLFGKANRNPSARRKPATLCATGARKSKKQTPKFL